MKLFILLVLGALIADSLQSLSIRGRPTRRRHPTRPYIRQTPFHLAAMNGTVDEVREFIEKPDADLNASNMKGYTPFHNAVKYNGDVNVAKEFLKHNVDVNVRNNLNNQTALHLAVERGHVMMAKMLLDAGADVNAMNWGQNIPLHIAQNKDVAKLLLEHNANVSARNVAGQTPMQNVISHHIFVDTEIIRSYVQHGADVNARDSDGNTLLHYHGILVSPNRTKCVIESGADLTVKNLEGKVPFMVAISSYWFVPKDTLQVFIDHHQAVNITDDFGNTPLHYACHYHDSYNLDAARLLINHSADVNARNKDGNSPLHTTASGASITYTLSDPKEMFQLLLDSGANANATNNNGETPCDLIKPPHGFNVSAMQMAILNRRRANLNCAALP